MIEVDLEAVRARRERGVGWMDDGLPPADVDETKGARATWLVLVRDLPALMDEVLQLRRVAATCTCQAWPPEGPAPDCPVHGAVRALNEARADAASAHAEGVRAGWEQAVKALAAPEVLIVMANHVQTGKTGGCLCGWFELGRLHPRHLAEKIADALASLAPTTEEDA